MKNRTDQIIQYFKRAFPFEPTGDQIELMDRLADFTQSQDHVFVIKGYAGTGKTTILSTYVKVLRKLNRSAVLMAPTGRAAKVFSGYSKRPAYTIHKSIYQKTSSGEGGYFKLRANLRQKAIFIVDEASMIGNQGGMGSFGPNGLLDDLMEFVFSGHQCKLILIGDAAQLPPVGTSLSPALNLNYLKSTYGYSYVNFEIKEVVRQAKESEILANSTALREDIRNREDEVELPKFTANGEEVIRVENGDQLQESIEKMYDHYGPEHTCIICRSNKRAYLFNQQIRSRILWYEEEIAAGDLLMVVKNNYFWLEDKKGGGFIANGETLQVQKYLGEEELYGFRFADLLVKMLDYPEVPEMEVKVLLDTLSASGPAMSRNDNKRLYEEIAQDFPGVNNRRQLSKKILETPHYNALQVKYAYAVTCHKAQGGQWPAVFLDQGYFVEDMLNRDYLRWLYTGITRATETLYLVGFQDQFYD